MRLYPPYLLPSYFFFNNWKELHRKKYKNFRKKKKNIPTQSFFYSKKKKKSLHQFLQLNLAFLFPHFLFGPHLPLPWYLLARPGHMISENSLEVSTAYSDPKILCEAARDRKHRQWCGFTGKGLWNCRS